MQVTLKQRLNNWERQLNQRFGRDISTPAARRRAWIHYLLIDHGWIRALWSNLHEVAPGVWRSNQPSPARLRAIHAKIGLKAVLNLRGPSENSFRLFEAEECASLGLPLIDLGFSARKAPPRERLQDLVTQLRTLPRPFLFHCKSGADRTGLAAAIYLMVMEGRPVEEAMRQLSWRYAHVAQSDAGIQDHLLRLYAQAQRQTGIGFEDWLARDYDPAVLTASFARWRAGDRNLG